MTFFIFINKSGMSSLELVSDKNQSNFTEKNHSIHDKRQFEIAKLGEKAIYLSDLQSLISEVVKIVQDCLNTDYVQILKLTDDQTKLKLIDGVGWKDGMIGITKFDVDSSFQEGFTLINKRPVIIENFNSETRFQSQKIFVNYEVLSSITVLITGKTRPFGILGVYSKESMKFSNDDINFLLSVSFILSSTLLQQEYISKLKEEEEKSRILMEYASDAIVNFDQKGKILNVNTKVCEMTKFSKEELKGKNIQELFFKEDLEKNPIKFQEIKEGKHVLLERNLQTKDRIKVPIEISSTLLPNGTIQGIYRDITIRKEKEELSRNVQKMEAIERVAESLAHDFNNYLTIINSYSEKLAESITKNNLENSFHDLNQIKKITKRASSLSRELIRSNETGYRDTKVINVNDLITELDESIVILLGDRASIEYNISPDLFNVNVNVNQLQQSLLNLVINSKDAIKNKGSITIRTYNYTLRDTYRNFAFNAQPGEYVAISIIDTGTGMTDHVKTHLFEPYFTTKESKGNGLGLSSIYGFFREINGFIKVSSVEGIGTTITLFLKRNNEMNFEKKP